MQPHPSTHQISSSNFIQMCGDTHTHTYKHTVCRTGLGHWCSRLDLSLESQEEDSITQKRHYFSQFWKNFVFLKGIFFCSHVYWFTYAKRTICFTDRHTSFYLNFTGVFSNGEYEKNTLLETDFRGVYGGDSTLQMRSSIYSSVHLHQAEESTSDLH